MRLFSTIFEEPFTILKRYVLVEGPVIVLLLIVLKFAVAVLR
jgi:hypothetical protein